MAESDIGWLINGLHRSEICVDRDVFVRTRRGPREPLDVLLPARRRRRGAGEVLATDCVPAREEMMTLRYDGVHRSGVAVRCQVGAAIEGGLEAKDLHRRCAVVGGDAPVHP